MPFGRLVSPWFAMGRSGQAFQHGSQARESMANMGHSWLFSATRALSGLVSRGGLGIIRWACGCIGLETGLAGARWAEKGDDASAIPPVDAKVLLVNRNYRMARVDFTHPNETKVSKTDCVTSCSGIQTAMRSKSLKRYCYRGERQTI